MANGPDSISKIAVRGFKSIADEQQIELRPLTLLAGANSSGKSSLMQPILLLKQTLEAPSDPGPLLLDGPNVRFTSAEQLLSRLEGRTREPVFAVRIGLSSGVALEVIFKHEKGVGFDVAEMTWSRDNIRLAMHPKMSEEEIGKVLDTPPDGIYTEEEAGKLLPFVLSSLVDHFLAKSANGPEKKKDLHYSVYRERCFLSFGLFDQGAELATIASRGSLSPARRFVPYLQGLIHLPGLRGNPQRTYPRRAAGPLFPGAFQDYVASIVTQWQSKDDPRLSQLGAALEDMGLTWKVEAQPIDDTQVELRVGRLTHRRLGEKDLVSIADVGFGVSQSLPVLVALIVAEPGQVAYLEQPEMHLHPRAQRRLAHVLADTANRGVIVVAETHSALLLREVQTLVATGKLSSDKVKLHWFQRQEDGRTVVTAADLDENGAYGDWPEDFDEVELNAEKAYLDAVESKGAGE
jgi:hypothetical protein